MGGRRAISRCMAGGEGARRTFVVVRAVALQTDPCEAQAKRKRQVCGQTCGGQRALGRATAIPRHRIRCTGLAQFSTCAQ